MLRKFLIVCVLASLLGSLTFFHSNTGRASDDVSLGDPPTADEFSAASAGDPGEISLASASVDPSSRANAQSFYYSQYVAAPAVGWTGSYSSCTAGTTSSSFKDGMLQRLIYYRAMAGVPANIGLSSTFSSKNQAAALMFGAQGALSHDPPSSWACYTSTADEAAGSSNIALGASGTTALDLYMRDPGSNNAAVGHRRWILYPQTQTFGTGDTTASGGKMAANALWVFDGNFGTTRPGTRDGYVAWPNKGFVPYQVVPTRWSLSNPGSSFGGATVTVTLNGQPVSVAKESVVTGYGENTIVWQMEGR
ncbi:MAG: CAP domain-containing protein, partial [Thermomicrobiales bacterium]